MAGSCLLPMIMAEPCPLIINPVSSLLIFARPCLLVIAKPRLLIFASPRVTQPGLLIVDVGPCLLFVVMIVQPRVVLVAQPGLLPVTGVLGGGAAPPVPQLGVVAVQGDGYLGGAGAGWPLVPCKSASNEVGGADYLSGTWTFRASI